VRHSQSGSASKSTASHGAPYSSPASLTASQSVSTSAMCLTNPPSVIALAAVVARIPASSSPATFHAKVRRFRSSTVRKVSASVPVPDGSGRVSPMAGA
jgi:hypothetical protein